MSTYLVTGAVGFIGSRTCALLLDQGHRVHGIDSMDDAYDIRLKEWRLKQLLDRPEFAFHRISINDVSALRPLFAEAPAGVLNLAARAGVRQSVENPWIYLETNVSGTVTLLELCREYSVRKFVLASTSSLYGAHNPRPFREDADTNRVLSPYAASKKGAEVMCHTYHHLYGMDVAILRYFTVYGPAGRPDMSPFRFVQWIAEGRSVIVYGDGLQSRDFTFVDDIARGTIASLNLQGYNIINLGTDGPLVLMEVIRLIERIIGKTAQIEHRPMHAADVTATWADITRAQTLLGWRPSTTFENGIHALVEWYIKERQWAKDVVTG